MTRIRQILLGWLLTLTALTVSGEVLWWTTGEAADITVTYEGSTETTTAAALGATDARIRVVGDGVADETYLSMLFNVDGKWQTFEGADVCVLPVEEYWVDLGDYGSAGYSFVVELGNYEDGSWTVATTSAAMTYSQLDEAHHITANAGMALPGYTPWVATGYTAVPEPTSGLLMLLGSALLALRRKRMS